MRKDKDTKSRTRRRHEEELKKNSTIYAFLTVK